MLLHRHSGAETDTFEPPDGLMDDLHFGAISRPSEAEV